MEPAICICWIYIVSKTWTYALLLTICVENTFPPSLRRRSVSLGRAGADSSSPPYRGRDDKPCALLTDAGTSLSHAWCFRGTDELSIRSLLTSQSCFPKGRHNFPHLRTHREGRALPPLSEHSYPDIHLPLRQGLKVFLKPCKPLLCHLPSPLILQVYCPINVTRPQQRRGVGQRIGGPQVEMDTDSSK